MVLLIALLPALFVYLISAVTNSYFWTVAAGLFAITLGISTGNPQFLGVDLLFVAIALYIGHVQIQDQRKETARLATLDIVAKSEALRKTRLKALKAFEKHERAKLRKEQDGYRRAANDQSLQSSARARAASKVAEIESFIQKNFPE